MPDTAAIDKIHSEALDSTEVTLIRRCQEGREDSFRELMEKYERRVYWISFSMLSNHENARDVTQETFIRVFKNIGRFDVTRKFYTWLYQITVNLCIDRKRRISNSKTVDIDRISGLADRTFQDPASGMVQEERRARVMKTLDRLPPPYKTILTLRDIHGFSCPEIREILGCSDPTLRWRLFRARQLFKALWEGKTTASISDSETDL